MIERDVIEGFKVCGDFFETQNLINMCIVNNQNSIKWLNRKSFILYLAASAIGLILYEQDRRIEKLTNEIEELKRMKGE